MSISADEVKYSLREAVKSLSCPACETELTDFAVDWGEAYHEGQRDLLRELGHSGGRDGLFALKCELCEARLGYDYFTNKVRVAGDESKKR